MADQSANLVDLPLDILYLIFPYLDVPSFVALTSTCKALHDPELAQYAPYWSSAARTTFRVPNQPVVASDGQRWQKMYRRLLTESRCYTWGNNDRSCLGHGVERTEEIIHLSRFGPPHGPRFRTMPAARVSWPMEVDTSASLGIIADMQCGGWTTNLLTSKGGLYSIGVMDGQRQQAAKPTPQQLRYPAGFPHPHERYDPVTAISQFSAGRSHVLGLSDGGNIWAWGNIGLAALQIKFVNIDLASNDKVSSITPGFVKKVVAGWSLSTALVVGTGIIVWDPVTRNAREGEEDTMLILEPVIVPGTGFQRNITSSKPSSGSDFGEVQNFICLEHYIIFVTHLGKVYAAQVNWSDQSKDVSDVREIRISATEQANDQTMDPPFVTDVQGSFRSFAIFLRSGAVLTGNQDHLAPLFSPENSIRSLERIPALQDTQVISLAFGDYHFHALHAPGYITSYGREPQGCGCLGLGGHGTPEGRLRGVRYQGLGGDGSLVPHANLHGRRVWFEKEKQKWITFLASGGNDPEEARERMQLCSQPNVQGEVSEWVEQEGNAWEERYGGSNMTGKGGDGLGSYFALSVTAAGWHSGALVLVNEDMASKVREGCVERPEEPPKAESTNEQETTQEQPSTFISRTLGYAGALVDRALGLLSIGLDTTPGPGFRDPNDPTAFTNPRNHGASDEDGRPYVWSKDAFPRLRLANGEEMPGTVEFHEWRNGRPRWEGNVAGY